MIVYNAMTGDGITFFCLNLRFGLADDGSNSWEFRKHCYPSLLQKYPCDFYGFQEANDFQISYLQYLLSNYDVLGWRSPAPDRWQNNVIFHHRSWECRYSDHFFLSDTPDLPSKFACSRWPRQCTMGIFQREECRITVINTHFDFDPEVQRKSAVLILDRLSRLAHPDPAVLMGDLNAGPDDSCLAALTDAASGFKSTVWHPRIGTYHAFSGIPQGPPIDWILYRGNLNQAEATVVTDRFEGLYPSDHFPLTAVFKCTADRTQRA